MNTSAASLLRLNCVQVRWPAFLALFAAAWTHSAALPGRVLQEASVYLGSPDQPEWDEFAGRIPAGRDWVVRFEANPGAGSSTIVLRQDDVRYGWRVTLNGRALGSLHEMEAPLLHTFTVPPGTLKAGANELRFAAPKENDSVVLGPIWLLDDTVSHLATATAEIQVLDADSSEPTPARLTVIEAETGSLALLEPDPASPPVAIRPGVAYTGNGRARVRLLPGKYRMIAGRGFEYGVDPQEVTLTPGERALTFRIAREVPTPGWISSDTHTHTFTFSRHGDATVEERALTLAGEGIELPIATDHNILTDYEPAALQMGVRRHFTPVIGNEVTTARGHFNTFPVHAGTKVPDAKTPDWNGLFKSMRATPGVRVVILNHPRDVHSGFAPFGSNNFNGITGESRSLPVAYDALELINSSAQQPELTRVFPDWFALLNRGHRITGVGSSDGHDVSRYIIGQGRTFLRANDADPARIDAGAACQSLLAGRALVSLGLLTLMRVDGKYEAGDLARPAGDQLRVDVDVFGPDWARADTIELFANGASVRTLQLTPRRGAWDGPRGRQAHVVWDLPLPTHDVWLVARATGPGVRELYWPIARPYQRYSPRWDCRVLGSTNPIWIDADKDGQFTAPYFYAERLWKETRGNLDQLLERLAPLDRAVAIQAASLAQTNGVLLNAPEHRAKWEGAPPAIREAFAAVLGASLSPQ